jgi:hypothetical protein
MGPRVELEAREHLLGHRCATDHLAPFEDENLESGFGQVGGGDEAIVPGTDNDGVVLVVHRYQSFRISSAASRPEAPVIPPPG